MTDYKDVPTTAYHHGFIDGQDESKRQIPKNCADMVYEINHDKLAKMGVQK